MESFAELSCFWTIHAVTANAQDIFVGILSRIGAAVLADESCLSCKEIIPVWFVMLESWSRNR